MAELCKSIQNALNNIRGQIDNGYIDLGIHDGLEIKIIDNALCVWEERMTGESDEQS